MVDDKQELYFQICSYPNLLAAWDKVEGNNGCPGVDGVSVWKFEDELGENLINLQSDMQNETYKPLPLLRLRMTKPKGGMRYLSIPTVRDRLAQKAVCNILSPIFENEFETCSFAYRPGKSRHDAIYQIRTLRDEGYSWIVDADIEKFFDSVDHDILLERTSEIITDAKILQLIRMWITTDIYDSGNFIEQNKGLPQGAVVSPLLANLYLDKFDEFFLAEGYKMVRFADDFLILCKTKPKAEEVLKITQKLLQNLKLSLESSKTQIVSFNDGFEYLGAIFMKNMVLMETIKKPKGTVSGFPTSEEFAKIQDLLKKSGAGDTVTAFPFSKKVSLPIKENKPRSLITPFMRTLYLQEQGCTLRKEDERFIVEKDDKILLEVQAIKVEQIVIFGNSMMTTPTIAYCLREDIPVTFLSSRGNFYGQLESFSCDNVLLQKEQFLKAADGVFSLNLAKTFVCGKIKNCRVLIQRRTRKDSSLEHEKSEAKLAEMLKKIPDAQTLEELNGYEGASASVYFAVYRQLFKYDMGFSKRVRRPPTDPINSLLSFGYTMLFQNAYSMVRTKGLNPHVGFIHQMHPGHPALVSDLIEEFRAPVVDSLVLYLINSKILTQSDFFTSKEKGEMCLMTKDARKKFLKHFEDKMRTEVRHPATNYTVSYRKCIDLQARQMAQLISGNISEYTPFEIR